MSFPSCASSEFNFRLGCWVITPRAGTPPIAILLYHLSPAGVGGRNLADKEQGFNETVCRVCFLSFVCCAVLPHRIGCGFVTACVCGYVRLPTPHTLTPSPWCTVERSCIGDPMQPGLRGLGAGPAQALTECGQQRLELLFDAVVRLHEDHATAWVATAQRRRHRRLQAGTGAPPRPFSGTQHTRQGLSFPGPEGS